jgi:hypothetical protein
MHFPFYCNLFSCSLLGTSTLLQKELEGFEQTCYEYYHPYIHDATNSHVNHFRDI